MTDKQLIEIMLSSLNQYGYLADRNSIDLMLIQILIAQKDQYERLRAISGITDLNEDPNIVGRFKNDVHSKVN